MLTVQEIAQDDIDDYALDLIKAGKIEYGNLERSEVERLMILAVKLIFTPSAPKPKSEVIYFIEMFADRVRHSIREIIDDLLEHRNQVLINTKGEDYDDDEIRET